MRKWNASMPREKSSSGQSHVVVAYKHQSGQRMEFEGQLLREDAQQLVNLAIEMMKKTKPGSDK